MKIQLLHLRKAVRADGDLLQRGKNVQFDVSGGAEGSIVDSQLLQETAVLDAEITVLRTETALSNRHTAERGHSIDPHLRNRGEGRGTDGESLQLLKRTKIQESGIDVITAMSRNDQFLHVPREGYVTQTLFQHGKGGLLLRRERSVDGRYAEVHTEEDKSKDAGKRNALPRLPRLVVNPFSNGRTILGKRYLLQGHALLVSTAHSPRTTTTHRRYEELRCTRQR